MNDEWPKLVEPAPVDGDIVQVVMHDWEAKRLAELYPGLTLGPAMRFSEDDVPTYVLSAKAYPVSTIRRGRA